MFWPLELRKLHGDPLFLNLIFTYFPLMKTQQFIHKFLFYHTSLSGFCPLMTYNFVTLIYWDVFVYH